MYSKMADSSKPLEVYPPIHRLGAVGRWIRARLMAEILRGTPVLVKIETLRTPWRNGVMQASSFLGEEEFYMLLVGLVTWIVDAKLGRLMVLLMGICFYVAGFLKNLLCLPRPPSPPVTPLQRCQDWSLPSHHAVLNVNVPWFIWFYLYHNYSLSLYSKMALFLAISLWSFSVMMSRIYLGVHSPADILTGGVVGCGILATWLQCYERVDVYLSSSPSLFSVIGIICVIVFLLSVHPDPIPTTIIFAETVCMVGVAVGFILGQILTPPTGRGLLQEAWLYTSGWSIFICSVSRFMVGLVALVTTKLLTEKLSRTVLKIVGVVAGVTTVCNKRKSEVTSKKVHFSSNFKVLSESQPKNTKCDYKPLNIDITVKFISYTAMGLVGMATCPALFSYINI